MIVNLVNEKLEALLRNLSDTLSMFIYLYNDDE